MELPRRRTGSYEPRSNIGNVLAPVSGLQGSAEIRTTPSVRSAAATAASKPPWATGLDVSDVPQSQAQPHQHHPPSGRSSTNSRPQRACGKADQDSHGFSFHTPAPTAATAKPSSPEAPARHTDAPGGSTSWDNLSGPWPNTRPSPARPQSGGRTGNVDQIDLWSQQQQQQHVRHNEELYARVEHLEVASTAHAAVGSTRRGAPVAAAAVAGPRRGNSSGDGPRPPPSDGASAIAPCNSATTGHGGAGGVTSRTSASTARPVHSNESRTPGRSTSTPKPRPAAPPKRSTSITDNVRRDWVDVSVSDRKAGGSTASKAGSGGSSGGGHWDADPDGHDRGSWLFSANAEQQPSSRGPDLDPPTASDRRRLSARPSSAGHAGSADGGLGDGGGGRMSSGRHERHPLPLPRPRPQSPALGDLEATLSPPAAAPAAVLAGSSSMGEISLGHGPTADLGSRSRGASTAGHGNGRQGVPSASQTEAARHMQAMQEENSRLRDQVQHLERLLAAATPVAAVEAGRNQKGSTTVVPRPLSAGCMDAASSIAAAAASGVVLQQYKSQVIQLQRQVALMSQEIEAKARLSFEAEGALLEMASKLAELATAGGNSATGTAGNASVPAVLPGVTAEAAAGLSSGGEALSRDRLMQLHKWSKQMLGRLRSEKSESSKLFTQQAYDSRGLRGGSQGAASWTDRGSSTAAAAVGNYAPTWVVPFLPAGGNRFLITGGGAPGAGGEAAADDLAGAAGGGGGTSMAAIAGGQAVLLADPLLAHRLELQLAAVAPKLAALAVLLKTQLLPAMPWLGLEAADRLQAEVGEASEGVAQSVEALVQLCSLLPAGAAVFGEGPVAQEPKRRAAEIDAGRDSWLYGSPELLDASEPRSPAVDDEGVINIPRLQAAIAPLLRDRKTGNKALMDILEPVRSKSQSAVAKRAVLEAELRFAARASALHAEHVSHLMLSVGMALEECRGAKDAAMIKAYFNGAAAVRQVLEAADALELHPCETCLKALVDVIQVHRETLGRLPELLVNAPAADVEGRLLSKVEELHQGFKKAVSRLEAHKRRHMDARARGVVCGAVGDQDLDSNYNEDSEEHQNEERGDSAGGGEGIGNKGSPCVGTGEKLVAAVARRPPLTPPISSPPQQVMAAKPGKPPKPRQEWLD